MTDLKKQERAAIEAVARRFSATWEKGSNLSGTYIKVGGKRIAVDITTLKQHDTGQRNDAKARLRFDKVVIRVMGRLQTALDETVPGGMTVLLTITAPIRLASRTAAALERKIQTLLERGSAGHDEKDTIHGNHVRIQVLRNGSLQSPKGRGSKGRAPKMIGFVHNSDTDPLLLLNMTRELFVILNTEGGWPAKRLAPKRADERWLVVISARRSSCLEAYRYIYSQLSAVTFYKTVLIVFGDGHVEALTE